MSTLEATPAALSAASAPARPAVPGGRAALAGIAAAGLTLGVAELAAGLIPGVPSPVITVGAAAIELQPAGAKEVFVALFGEADKLVLNVIVVATVLLVAAAVGVLARARPVAAPLGIGALVAAGVLATGITRGNLAFAVLAGAVTFLVGTRALEWLLRLARVGDPASAGADGGAGAAPPSTERTLAEIVAARRGPAPSATATDPSRRRFLAGAGLLAAAGAASGAIGRTLLDGRAEDTADADTTIPAVTEPAAPIPAGAELAVTGLTRLVVPNADFYRIDTALVVPSVTLDDWRLGVTGMVDRPFTMTFAELVELPLIERYVTIACVSNEVGGDLVGNAKWTGVRLTDLLEMAGVQAGATQIVPRSVDGWTAGFPTAWVTEQERDALVAVRMNDEPLPVEHGFPARLIVPGLYGYVSATKWLAEIELTTLEAFDAYWIPRGWAKQAPILTQSRIDVPRFGAQRPAGRVEIAGVAWAPERGITAVEVQIDGAGWRPATLGAAISDQTWVQWRFGWDATAGVHTIGVRATDGTGEVQTTERTRPDPDGARGHHTIQVTIT